MYLHTLLFSSYVCVYCINRKSMVNLDLYNITSILFYIYMFVCVYILALESAERRCSSEGQWEGKPGIIQQPNSKGWTNYTPCYTPELFQLIKKLYAGGNEDVAKVSIYISHDSCYLYKNTSEAVHV